MDILLGLSKEVWYLLAEMSPYLLFGFFVAGLLNLVLSKDKVAKHLSHNNVSSVIKASILGVPLPLCSCGVIPVAAHLEKQGANRGPILSFLISTPTTGVDSVLATYSLMGPLLAIMRPIAALVNGLFTGVLANWVENRKHENLQKTSSASESLAVETAPTNFSHRMKGVFRYAFIDLVDDVAKWLVIGIVAGGVISYLIPANLIEAYLGNPFLAYPLMLLIGIPMYVCATGSIPIAASLMLKGMSPGAGFIFLFAGPATNTATLSFVGGKMGKKSLAVYLTTILICGVIFGGIIDFIWNLSGQDMRLISGHTELLPDWLKIGSAILLILLMLRPYLTRSKTNVSGEGMVLTVPDMSCNHCKLTIHNALREVDGVEDVKIDIPQRQVEIIGQPAAETVLMAVEKAGYHISNRQGKENGR